MAAGESRHIYNRATTIGGPLYWFVSPFINFIYIQYPRFVDGSITKFKLQSLYID